MVCPTQVVALGPTPTSIDGDLTSASCQRYVLKKQRPVDVYSVAGTPGTAIKVDVSASAGSIAPYVVLSDAGGQFGAANSAGGLPIEFYVTTSEPYEFMVTSSSPTVDLGPYTLTVSNRSCPTPVPLVLPSPPGITVQNKQIGDPTECPDPGAPSTASEPNPSDLYSFTVTQVPTNVSITMQQLSAYDDLYATLAVRSPSLVPGGDWYNGLELVPFDIDTDCSDTGDTTCARVRFLALQPGTYAIIASGYGGTGSYRLSLSSPTCSATALSNIPSNRPLQCNDQHAGCACSQESGGSSLCGGTFTYSANSGCAAPLQIPGISDEEPEDVASPADLYTFTASAGDVISVLMTADDDYSPGDAHLYLLGPAPGVTPIPGTTPPNVLIAQDDDSGSNDNNGFYDAELAATLVQGGTYTIVAANNYQMYPEDDPVPYTLHIQKCLSQLLAGPVSDTFSGSDCVGYGGIPYRSYGFATGHAGDLLSARVSSNTVDTFVRILGNDGSRVENDTDPFSTGSTDARASRIVEPNVIYYIEVSTSLDGGAVDTTDSPDFTLTTQTCPAKPANSATLNGTFGSSSCTLSSGQKFDVYTFTPVSIPSVASVSPPNNGCVLNLLAQGAQTPDSGCSLETSDMPLMSAGRRYGFIIAADDADVTGAYTVQFRQACPLASASFGDVIAGTLSGTDCATADGSPAKWYLVQGPADVVQFNAPVSGTLAADFPFSGALTDIFGVVTITKGFLDDSYPPNPFFQFPLAPSTVPPPPFGGDIGFLVRITGATASDVGSYTLKVDPAWYTGNF
jgi:hypothetical protein